MQEALALMLDPTLTNETVENLVKRLIVGVNPQEPAEHNLLHSWENDGGRAS